MAWNRMEHQPLLEVEQHEQPSTDELTKSCGNIVGLVLACDWNTTPLKVLFDDPDAEPFVCEEPPDTPRPLQLFEGKPLIAHAGELAASCGFSATYTLLMGEGDFEAAGEAVKAVAPDMQFLGCSNADADDACAMLGGFSLYDIPSAPLAIARQLLEENPEASAVMLLACDTPRITPWHIKQLCDRFAACPEADVVSSWIYWLTRLPILVSRKFFATVEEQGLMDPGMNGMDLPMPRLQTEQVVFGEEKLLSNECESKRREAFLKGHTLSALAAVRKARAFAEMDDEDVAQARKEMEEHDRELVDLAGEVQERLDALTAEYTEDLESLDEWGHRNKRDFPLFMDRTQRDSLVYLDSAATSQRLDCALQAQSNFDKHENANIYRGLYKLSAQATGIYNEARAVIEGHLNADRRQTVYTGNTTMSCNTVAYSWGMHNLNKGDLVLVSLAEHHSNMLPWRMVAELRGADVAYIPLLGDGRIDMDAYEQLLKKLPKLVAVAQIGNVLGIENPVKEMARMAHEAGARLFMDAAQSFPHIQIDVKELGVDFIAFSGHKAYGPLGIGGLWISEEAFAEMDPVMSGGGAISHVGLDSYYLRGGAIQYELGTPPIAQAVGLAAAVDHLDSLGWDAIQEHSKILTCYLVDGLHLIDGVNVWGDHTREDGQNGLISFSLYGVSPSRLAADLAALGVAIRAGGQCALPLHAAMGITGTGRMSLGIHNTAEDIEAALLAVAVSCRISGGYEPFASGSIADAADENDELSNTCASVGIDIPAEGREQVRVHYAQVASQVASETENNPTCTLCEAADRGEASTLYSPEVLEKLPAKALAASRGCGDPVAVANLLPGETVLDLGSGGGIDAIIASVLVGEEGHVYGVDMTSEMIELARANAAEAGVGNIEFLQGHIEDIPLPDSSVDAVISNCVINLSEDKPAVLREAARVLRPGGRLVVSDIVAFKPIPPQIEPQMRRITGCLNGMLSPAEYDVELRKAGFAKSSVEPKTVYTFEVLEPRCERKGRTELFEQVKTVPEADGATGSAIVRAWKE